MKRTTWMAAAIVAALGMSAAPAAAADYGQAGCGLGGIAVKQNNWLQIFAVTLNGILSNQLFGISTGTLGCDGAQGGTDSAKAFIETNREVFAKDAARGQGETIVALSVISGCDDAAAVGTSLQTNYGQIFSAGDLSDQEVSERVVASLQADTSLMCKGFDG